MTARVLAPARPTPTPTPTERHTFTHTHTHRKARVNPIARASLLLCLADVPAMGFSCVFRSSTRRSESSRGCVATQRLRPCARASRRVRSSSCMSLPNRLRRPVSRSPNRPEARI
eukprot:3996814-Pleurochrysis_carterae.AAC.1